MFTFPLGVNPTCYCQLGREMQSRFFAVLGTVCQPDLHFGLDTDNPGLLLKHRTALAHSVGFHCERHLESKCFCGALLDRSA